MLLNEIKKYNNEYKIQKEKVQELYKELRKINDSIDIDEVKRLKYMEVKELYNMLKYAMDDGNKLNEIESLMKEKKEQEYPEILNVHYYPEINKLNNLTTEEKVKLDKLIKESIHNMNSRKKIKGLDNSIKSFLMDHKIIRREYLLSCNCGHFFCHDKLFKEEELNKYIDYWNKKKNHLTTDEEDEEYNYGYIYIDCEHAGEIEIGSREEFFKYAKQQFEVIKEPDLTLDLL